VRTPSNRHVDRVLTETGKARGRGIDGGRRGLEVHFSSQTDEWATPQWLFEALDREFSDLFAILAVSDSPA
jgi:hypothetical protein